MEMQWWNAVALNLILKVCDNTYPNPLTVNLLANTQSRYFLHKLSSSDRLKSTSDLNFLLVHFGTTQTEIYWHGIFFSL